MAVSTHKGGRIHSNPVPAIRLYMDVVSWVKIIMNTIRQPYFALTCTVVCVPFIEKYMYMCVDGCGYWQL